MEDSQHFITAVEQKEEEEWDFRDLKDLREKLMKWFSKIKRNLTVEEQSQFQITVEYLTKEVDLESPLMKQAMKNKQMDEWDVVISELKDIPQLESDKFDRLYDKFIGRLKELSQNRKGLIKERNRLKKQGLKEQSEMVNQMTIDQYGHWAYKSTQHNNTFGELRLMVDVNNYNKDRSLKILKDTQSKRIQRERMVQQNYKFNQLVREISMDKMYKTLQDKTTKYEWVRDKQIKDRVKAHRKDEQQKEQHNKENKKELKVQFRMKQKKLVEDLKKRDELIYGNQEQKLKLEREQRYQKFQQDMEKNRQIQQMKEDQLQIEKQQGDIILWEMEQKEKQIQQNLDQQTHNIQQKVQQKQQKFMEKQEYIKELQYQETQEKLGKQVNRQQQLMNTMQTNKKNYDKEMKQKHKENDDRHQLMKDRIRDCRDQKRQWTKDIVEKHNQKEEVTNRLMREKEERNYIKKQKKEEEVQKVVRNNLERQLKELQKSIVYETAKNKSLYQTQEYKIGHQNMSQRALRQQVLDKHETKTVTDEMMDMIRRADYDRNKVMALTQRLNFDQGQIQQITSLLPPIIVKQPE